MMDELIQELKIKSPGLKKKPPPEIKSPRVKPPPPIPILKPASNNISGISMASNCGSEISEASNRESGISEASSDRSSSLRCARFSFFLLSIHQNERKIYFLREVCLLFNF